MNRAATAENTLPRRNIAIQTYIFGLTSGAVAEATASRLPVAGFVPATVQSPFWERTPIAARRRIAAAAPPPAASTRTAFSVPERRFAICAATRVPTATASPSATAHVAGHPAAVMSASCLLIASDCISSDALLRSPIFRTWYVSATGIMKRKKSRNIAKFLRQMIIAIGTIAKRRTW